MDWIRGNILKLNSDKADVLLISLKADQGIEMQPLLDEVPPSLKIQVRRKLNNLHK